MHVTPSIVLRGACRTYGTTVPVPALKPASLEIERGELVVILGPSGSGKTTLLNLIGGLDRPTAGAVVVEGVDLTPLSAAALTAFRRDKVGFVFQFYNLIPSLTAWENVELAAALNHHRRSSSDALAAVGLTDRSGHFPDQLSGGEQQRVAIARALAKDPPLILCDEPTGAVDFETGKRVLAVFEALVRREGKTVVIVTHNSALAAMATRVVRLKDGEVVHNQRQPAPVPAAELNW
jgi:putative ABC transport system ATP-binding protein